MFTTKKFILLLVGCKKYFLCYTRHKLHLVTMQREKKSCSIFFKFFFSIKMKKTKKQNPRRENEKHRSYKEMLIYTAWQGKVAQRGRESVMQLCPLESTAYAQQKTKTKKNKKTTFQEQKYKLTKAIRKQERQKLIKVLAMSFSLKYN